MRSKTRTMSPGLAVAFLAAAPFFVAASGAASEPGPCPGEGLPELARCTTVSVVENPRQPDGRHIDLEVVVLRGTGPEGAPPLFVLAGGPGQAATDLVGLGLGPWESVLETRDMVFVDQRGTGGSNSINCPGTAAEDPASVFLGFLDPDEIAGCLDRVSEHADVRFYDTEHVVEDLDLVREQLGYERVALWGGSGGTRTALVWLKRHPENVAFVLIDGVTPTDFRSPSGFARSAQRALDRVIADCDAYTACSTAFPALAADFDEVLALFDGGPVATHVTREDGSEVAVRMSHGDFGYSIRGLLYNSGGIRQLPGLIHRAAATGDVSPFAQRYWERQVNLRPAVSMGVHLSSVCTEDEPFIDPARIPELTEGTFLGSYLLDQYGGACEEWVRGEVPPDYLEPTRSDVPVLLVSGYYDPSTPPELAERAALYLANSRHIVVRNEGHGAEFGCAREATIEFLRTGSLADLGGVCEDPAPIEFELPGAVGDDPA